ncbi:hypothetical protein EGW08_013146 [Elysia chlorotica]|uniref:Calponin-homology (CH) domain-containing protein n=1 Tax=Elysia chlorotica TaxID=188477 RepID=A0A433TBV8_ELYCH|nr:hypothetical protein EGW08_013146 [Elysia chlorotica]
MAKNPAQSPMRRGRRSWFDAPPLTTLNCSEDGELKPARKKRSLDSVENLTLTHFTSSPRIDFGSVVLGKNKIRTLLIRNPHDYEQEVIVERFPYKKNFMIEEDRFSVQPGEVYSLEITWTPEEAGGVREMIQFHINEVFRLQAFLFGLVEQPKQLNRRRKKNGLGPKVRQQSILQTPALASIKSSYSPQRSEDARRRIEEADAIEHEKNKENSGHFLKNDNKVAYATAKDSITFQKGTSKDSDQERHRSSLAEQTESEHLAHSEHKAVTTPTPLESTAIMVRQEKGLASGEMRSRKQWKGISDGTATILNTMSPIPLNEGNEHGITVDSYYQPNDTSVFKQAKVNTSELLHPNARTETFAKPFLPSNAGNPKFKHTDRRSTTMLPSSAFTSNVGSLMHPDLTPERNDNSCKENTYMVSKASPLIDSHASLPKATNVTKIIHTSARSPTKKSPNTFRLSPSTPSRQRDAVGGVFSGASPNTMLNESLSLISDMKVPDLDGSVLRAYEADESGSSPRNEVNASLNCSIIPQGMVSPESFLEDMRNASISLSHNDCLEANSTSTPNLPNGGNPTADPNGASAFSSSISGTPNKPRPPSTRFGPKRRSFTSLFQKEQMKKVAAAVKAVKHDKDGLESVTQSSCKALPQKGSQTVRSKNGKQVAPSCRTVSGQGGKIQVSKTLEDKKKKRSPPRMKSPTKRLRKEPMAKQIGAKFKVRKENCLNESISEVGRQPFLSSNPDPKLRQFDSHTVVKSKSFESSRVTKNVSDNVKNQSHYFPDLFSDDHDCVNADTNKASRQTRRQLCPDVTETSTSFFNPEFECSEPNSDKMLRDVADGCPNTYGRVIAAVEKIPSSPLSSPSKFRAMSPANLPTSPCSMTLDQGRRATLTVTKSRPSDALLAAMNNRKRLFDETVRQEKLNRKECVTSEGDLETCENFEVTVKESYEEREGKVYLLVQETTRVTKSTTDTYVEPVSVEAAGVSPGQFRTPTRLPSSPDPQLSRRSTHVLRSPKVIDKTGMRSTKLEFDKEKSNSVEDIAGDDDNLSKTKSDTFEKEPTFIADPDHQSQSVTKSNTFEKETSTLLESTLKSDTFETETTNVLSQSEDMVTALLSQKYSGKKWSDREPITAVCAMSPSLVDYDNASDDGGSAGNITKDSLDTTTQSEESLNKSKTCKNVAQERLADHNECTDDLKKSPEAGQEINRVTPVESEEEEDQFYDTQSQRYYDALSDTVDADLEDDLVDISDLEMKAISNESPKHCGEDVENTKLQDLQVWTNPGLLEKRVNAISDETGIDRRERFFVQDRQTLKMKRRDEGVPRLTAVPQHQEQNCQNKSKRKLRRSLSADMLDKPVAFSVDISDVKKSSGPKEDSKFEIGKIVQTASKKCPPKTQQDFLKPTNQSKTSKGRSSGIADSKLKSQSLSNLPNLNDKILKGSEGPGVKAVAKKSFFNKQQKGVPQSRLILLKKPKSGTARHPMPFAARNMYYDERWMEKQERGFVQWLNFVLTPPDEYVAATNKAKVNAGSLALDQKQAVPQLAPTKEVLSFRAYSARRRLNRLRRQACQLYQSDAVVTVIRKVEVEVESRRIAMRKDKMAHADLGIKQRMLDLLLQYSSLWLRVGLETIFGEILMLQSNQDVLGLSRFIVTRLLSSPDIAAEFAHPTVPHLYKEGYAGAVARHTVKKFLLLVYFLDYAKTSRLIEHDPCLFCKDAEIKSSREILVQFSREVLSGEGDITRHLAYLGYKVCQEQRPIDEFDFAVKNLSSDLKDGLRLSRVMEFMAGEQGIMGRLRTPAISRLQKVHNMDEFFKAAQKHGLDLSSSGVSARDVVDGHREKTLTLLWRIILFFQSCIQVDEQALREEISLLTKSLQLKLAMQKIGAISIEDGKASRDSGAGDTRDLMDGNARLQLILQWCRLVCLHYGVKIENFTVSFSDGRALCCLLHHYHPALLPLEQVRFETSVSHQEALADREEQELRARQGRSAGEDDADNSMDWGAGGGGLLPGENDPGIYEELLANEKMNFKTLYEKVSALGGVPLMLKSADMSNTIPDEKVVSTYVSYLCARLLDIRAEVHAARLIQMAWRRRLLRKALRERQKQIAAAKTLQRWIRPILIQKLNAKRERAAVIIQAWARRFLARRTVKHLRQKQLEQAYRSQREKAAVVMQKFWRARQARQCCDRMKVQKELEQMELKRDTAALTFQKFWRARVARQCCERLRAEREVERIELQQNGAAVVLQKALRGWKCRRDLSRKRTATVCLQMAWRRTQAKRVLAGLRHERDSKAATTLTKFARRFLCQQKYLRMKNACIVMQKNWRKMAAQMELERLKRERDERLARLHFEKETNAATLIQASLRGFLCRKNFLKLKNRCVLIQSQWRRCLAVRQVSSLRAQRNEKAAVVISKHLKGYLARRKFCVLKEASIVIQKCWRMHKAQRELARLKASHMENCALLIQKVMKGFHQRKKFKQLKLAAVTLQSGWRAKKARQELAALRAQHQNRAAIVIQTNFRAYSAHKKYLILKICTLNLQKTFRMVLAKKLVQKMKSDRRERSAVMIQKHFKGFQARTEFCRVKHAAVTLQTNWRRVQAQRRAAGLRHERRVEAATAVQAVWRGRAARSDYGRKRSAAVSIQSLWRMRSARKIFLKKRSAALTIQGWYRANLESTRQRSAFLQLRHRAVQIQSVWRGKKQRAEFLKAREAAILIQSRFRGHRRRLKFLALRLACVIIQRKFRAVVEGRKQRADNKRRFEAAICIQKFYREFENRRKLERTAAALVLQTVWRKIQATRRFQAQRAAAITIQTRFREHCAARACRCEFLKTKTAAKTIQSAFKAYMLRKKYAQFLQSVINVQACVRRNKAKNLFAQKQKAILVIQRKFRANKLGKVLRQDFLLSRNSAVKIQRFFRAVRQRREVQRKLAEERSAAVQIQASYRAYRVRCQYLSLKQAAVCIQQRYRAKMLGEEKRALFDETRQAVCILQIWWRSCLKMREARSVLEERKREVEAERLRRLEEERLEQERREEELRLKLEREVEEKRRELERWVEERRCERAAKILQRSWRGYLVMRDFVMRENAAVLIQTHVRGFLARLAYKHTVASVTCLQCAMKAWVYRRRFEMAKLGARIIQRWWREILAGRKLREDYLKLRDTAVKLQALARMKAQRTSYLISVKSIICVQAQVRMYFQRERFLQMKKHTTFLQQKIRAHQAMKRDRSAFLHIKHSAIKIQSFVRLWLALKAAQRERSAVKIQAFWRMHQQRSAFLQEYQAAQVLKSFMLMKQQQLENRARHEAAITIQHAVRSFLHQREVRRSKAAVTIQQAFRSFVHQREVRRSKAASTIQLWFRTVQRQQVEKKNSAAVVIVKTLRRVVFHKKLLRSRSAIVLQSAVRMFLERKRFLTLRRSVVLLQAAARGCLAREAVAVLRRRHRAASVIQAAVRGVLVRRRLAPVVQERVRAAQEHRVLQRASSRIQAWWRGYMIRRDVKSTKLIQARKRLEEANRSADESKTLGSRTASALDYLLQQRDLACILEALMHLETSTRLSPECCERMVDVNGVRVLYRLINSCNRSIPHMDLIKYSISILLNLAKYEKTIHAVLEPEECIGTLLELMQIYRDKGIIFYRSCMLLGVLGLDQQMRAHIHTHPGIAERLQSIHALVLRKQKAAQTRQTALDKMAAMRSSYNCTLPLMTPTKSRRRPRVRPCWSTARDAIKEFDDPTTAIHFVLTSLQIGAKKI